jgi:hypothetical protein
MSPLRTEQFDTPDPIRLRVGLAAGEVEIIAGPVTTTTVELDSANGRGAELVEQVQIQHRGGEFAIDVPEGLFGRERGRAKLKIKVSLPEDSTVHANLASADLMCRGRLDTVDASTASGEVHLDDVTHDVKVTTASGDVSIGHFGAGVLRSGSGDIALRRIDGDAEVHTASGDVLVSQAGGSVRARTASGDIAIKVAQRGELEINSASGDVLVGVASGVGVWLDLSTMSGDTSSDLAIGDRAPAEGCDLRLTARTMSGDIQVSRAAAPTSG